MPEMALLLNLFEKIFVMDIFLTVHFIIATLPLLICFLFAVHDSVFRLPSRAVFPPFANRWTGYGGAWIVVLLIVYCCAWIVFTFGGCDGTIKGCCTCAHIPRPVGDYAYTLMFFGFIYIVTTLVPALVLLAGADLAFRFRLKKATAP